MNGLESLGLSVLLISIVWVLFDMVLPDEQGAITKSYIKYITSLCVIAALLLPLKTVVLSAVGDINGGISDYSEEYSEINRDISKVILSETEDNLENALRDEIASKYSIIKSDISVNISLECNAEGDVKVSKIKITMKAVPVSVKEISEFIFNNCGTYPELNFINGENIEQGAK